MNFFDIVVFTQVQVLCAPARPSNLDTRFRVLSPSDEPDCTIAHGLMDSSISLQSVQFGRSFATGGD